MAPRPNENTMSARLRCLLDLPQRPVETEDLESNTQTTAGRFDDTEGAGVHLVAEDQRPPRRIADGATGGEPPHINWVLQHPDRLR